MTVSIPEPSITVIIGPNAAGKSTFLKAMLGSVPVKGGRIEVLGVDSSQEPDRAKRLVSYVAQQESFSYPVPILVKEVVGMGLLVEKAIPRVHNRSDDAKVVEALKAVDMEEYLKVPFDTLSGGQKQRVLLARSIIRHPRLLLLDEPFNGVDVVAQLALIEYLARLRKSGVGIVIVTHDSNPLAKVIEYIMVLNRRLVCFGTPRAVLKPEVLAEVYGASARVIDSDPCPFVVIGDVHA